MGNGEKNNAEGDAIRGELHRIEQDLTPQEWATWIWHGTKQFEELLAKHAAFQEQFPDE